MFATYKFKKGRSGAASSGSFIPPFAVQKKLIIGASNDTLELEADRVADQVVSSGNVNAPNQVGANLGIQRKCAACQEEEGHLQKKSLAASITPMIQRSAPSHGQEGTASQAVSTQISGLKGKGNSMDSATRQSMETGFGTEFSSVRIHTGASAVQLSKELHAQAFTVGNDIFFNQGMYSPNSSSGKHLLAHELTHTIQQKGQGSGGMLHRKKHTFTPGRPAHNHKPGHWAAVQAHSKANCNPLTEAGRIHCVCAFATPAQVMAASFISEFRDKPIASVHLFHYLSGGGKTIDEDSNLVGLINRDSQVRDKIAAKIATANKGHFFLRQGDYSVQDFRFAFGGVDRVEWEVDTAAGTVDIWFKDRYDFHPVGFGYKHKGTGDSLRITNCIHAAAVELKSSGAADYWMEGEATFPLAKFPKPKKPGGSGDDL